MEKKTFTVPNIGCNGCVQTIINELRDKPGVQSVTGSAPDKKITVEWTGPASWDSIRETLASIDYPAAEPA